MNDQGIHDLTLICMTIKCNRKWKKWSLKINLASCDTINRPAVVSIDGENNAAITYRLLKKKNNEIFNWDI